MHQHSLCMRTQPPIRITSTAACRARSTLTQVQSRLGESGTLHVLIARVSLAQLLHCHYSGHSKCAAEAMQTKQSSRTRGTIATCSMHNVVASQEPIPIAVGLEAVTALGPYGTSAPCVLVAHRHSALSGLASRPCAKAYPQLSLAAMRCDLLDGCEVNARAICACRVVALALLVPHARRQVPRAIRLGPRRDA